jgi:hypothetical protein
MKTQRINKIKGNFLSGIIIMALLFLMASCTKSEPFLNSSVVPAATGNVKVKKDNNNNYTFKIRINDLAEVGRLKIPRQTYVVWMETEKGNTENLGQLKSSTKFISKQHSASLKATSPFKPVRIFVTAENESNVRYPDREVILTTDTFFK